MTGEEAENSLYVDLGSGNWNFSGVGSSEIQILNEGVYIVSIKQKDRFGRESPVVGPIEVVIDNTPPGEVSGVAVAYGADEAIVTWTDPADEDLASVELVDFPADITTATVGATTEQMAVAGALDGTAVEYLLVTVDAVGNESEGFPVSIKQ